MTTTLRIKHLGRQDYQPVWQEMHDFTNSRDSNTLDEIWLVEHNPVFTQGQAGKAEHILQSSNIPIVKSDRGGQVTYHGPGQLVAYVMIDLRRKKLGVRDLVTHIENTVINTLATFDITSTARPDAPGVYVDNKKICSLGLRIRRGCSFHGLALNINMDLSPFLQINPCGYAGMEMTQVSTQGGPDQLCDVEPVIIQELATLLDYQTVQYEMDSDVTGRD